MVKPLPMMGKIALFLALFLGAWYLFGFESPWILLGEVAYYGILAGIPLTVLYLGYQLVRFLMKKFA